ncbi:MAG: nicotinate-nucleotide--dimethylbenzimidazole phosphoribosyltransferase [Bacillota bacterium]
MKRWKQIRGRIRRPDPEIRRKALRHWNNLTKPLGSLGRLEETAIRLAGITGEVVPDLSRKAVLVMCGDHGVAEEGVSAYPQEVTGLMIDNFARGGAAINVLARRFGAELVVVDVGSKAKKLPPSVIDRRVRPGTANMTAGPAMTREEALQALDVGIDRVEELVRGGVRMIAIGEMGIGNTTAGTAIAAVFTGRPVEVLTGRGTGIDDRAVLRKREAIRRAIEVNRPDPADPIGVLAKVGGLEIAGMAGAVLGAAAAGIPVVLDGMISTAAALAAARLLPEVSEYLFASHLSAEPAHRFMLEELGLRPLIDAEMRLGEGTGAVLCFPLIDGALSLAREMATFADLGLAGPAEERAQHESDS